MKNLTYNQLIELAPKDRPFQIEVESNPYGYGTHQKLWAYIKEGELSTETTTKTIDGTAYFWHTDWKYNYTGTFTLIDPRHQKPEVLKVGQKVRIMESARDIGDYWQGYEMDIEAIGEIVFIQDDDRGLSYDIDFGEEDRLSASYPHYCVMPVEEEKTPERTLEDILSELSDTDKEIIKSKLK